MTVPLPTDKSAAYRRWLSYDPETQHRRHAQAIDEHRPRWADPEKHDPREFCFFCLYDFCPVAFYDQLRACEQEASDRRGAMPPHTYDLYQAAVRAAHHDGSTFCPVCGYDFPERCRWPW